MIETSETTYSTAETFFRVRCDICIQHHGPWGKDVAEARREAERDGFGVTSEGAVCCVCYQQAHRVAKVLDWSCRYNLDLTEALDWPLSYLDLSGRVWGRVVSYYLEAAFPYPLPQGGRAWLETQLKIGDLACVRPEGLDAIGGLGARGRREIILRLARLGLALGQAPAERQGATVAALRAGFAEHQRKARE